VCDAKSEGGRRCLSSIPISQGGTRGMSKAQKAEFYANRETPAASREPSKKETPKAKPSKVDKDKDLDLTHAMARGEADKAAHAAWLATEPTPIEVELALYGLAGLGKRYGFDHNSFSARFLRHDDLAELDIPGMGPVPTLAPGAGELGAIVLKPAAAGQPWHPMSGLTLTWRGDGDASERERFHLLLGSWFTGLFAALRTRLDAQRAA
jgi:hypothetical protein